MIFNKLFFVYVVTVFFRAIQVDTCFSGNIPTIDSEFDIAIQLKTGFKYPQYDDIYKLGIASFKKLLGIENLPNENTIKNPIDIIYSDLACGNMYILLNYLEICKNLHDSCLNETITRHMIGSLFKIKKTIYVKPFWFAHMYMIHSSIFQYETDNDHINCINEIKTYIKYKIRSQSDELCRMGNKFKMSIQYDNNLNPTTQVNNIIKIVNEIQNNNDILLEKKEKNWASLKSIYLHKIIEDDEILKTIIMTFGDRDNEVYKAIHDDIHKDYEIAKNCYYFDLWVIALRNYQEKMLNIIRTVALHLIKKHLLHANEYWKSKYIFRSFLDVGHIKMKMFLLENHFFTSLFRPDDNKVLDIVNNLNCFKKIEKGVNKTHYEQILDVENIMSTLLPTFANKESEAQFFVDDLNKISYEDKNLNDTISKKNLNKINEFQKKFDYPPLRDNFKKIIFYLQYLENIFEEYNIEITLSFTETFQNYKKHCHKNCNKIVNIKL